MRVLMYSDRPSNRESFETANALLGDQKHDFTYTDARFTADTARLADGHDGVCLFVNDQADADALRVLANRNVRIVALRSAGFNHVDVRAAHQLGLCVCRVPAYSPHAVAEHTLALILSLNRRIPRAWLRVRDNNFSLEGLLGFDMNGKTAGVVGTGKIGALVAKLLAAFGCEVLVSDPYENPALRGVATYVSIDEIFARSDIVTLHCPLTPTSKHLVNHAAVRRMKPGVMLVNTSRGGLVDTNAVIDGLKNRHIGYLALDVYEEEEGLFFEDLSGEIVEDDRFARLTTFPNVIVTAHQAYFTRTALRNIAETTLDNLTAFEQKGECRNAVLAHD